MRTTLQIMILIIAILSGSVKTSFGQDNQLPKETYQASAIPDSLKKRASSVVRYSEVIITVKAAGRAIIKHHSIITLLNKNAQGLAGMTMVYNKKYDTYSGVKFSIYDDKGSLVKKYHKSDMYDGSAANNQTMVTDERFLALKHNISTYPVTIEKEYEEDRDSFIDLGERFVQLAGQAVEHSVIKVVVSPSLGFRYKTLNMDAKPVVKSLNGLEEYTWEFNGLKELRHAANATPLKVVPGIEMAVNAFNCYGYPGDFSSWQSFGKWIQFLNSDAGALSPQRIAAIRKMTDSIKSDQGKARFLYHYLQQNVRYVNIDLGIGGYKPLPASFVDEKKYGDCKALSNYMRALLNAVNINADYVIIGAGSNAWPLDPAFPCNRFNHAILCVPFKNDTTWLECTSNTQPFGKLGPFTENRKALLIDKDGGKLVNTPRSNVTDNQFNSEASIALNADGSAKTTVKIITTGAYRSYYLSSKALSNDRQKEFFMHLLKMRQFSDFNITRSDTSDGRNELNLEVTYEKFCDIVSADKLFLRPFAFDLCTYNIPADEKRKTDLNIEYPMAKSCNTTISLPVGFKVETMPPGASLKFTYGSYEINYVYDQEKHQVVSTAKFNITNATIPPKGYTELQQFVDAVNREQRRKLVVSRM